MSDNIAQIIHNSSAAKNLLFTCHACSLTFPSSDIQRYHMKSDWHRYNLKRKIEGLLPVSSEEFQTKMEIFNAMNGDTSDTEYTVVKKHPHGKHSSATSDIETSDGADYEDSSSSDEEELPKDVHGDTEDENEEYIGAFDVRKLNKIDSLTHHNDGYSDVVSTEFYKTTDIGDNSTTTDGGFNSRDVTTDDAEYISSDTDESDTNASDSELSVNECVFCYHLSKDSERNIRHMFTKHGFYIPDRSFLVDLAGLLSFIDYIVNCEEHCLVCEYQGKGIKHHLEKKRHCRMIYETPQQKKLFRDYYDYSTADELSVKRTNETPNEVKKIKFALDVDQENEHVTVKNSKDHQNKEELAQQRSAKLARQQKVLTAIDSYKKSAKMYPGVSAKQSEAIVKQMQSLEIRYQYKQTNKSAIKQSNFQKHYRDPLLQ